MAQDFKAAFHPGTDDRSITTVEFDGVAPAAIHGLNQKADGQAVPLRVKDAALQALKTGLVELPEAVPRLTRIPECQEPP